MFQGNDFAEEFVLRIERKEELLILAGAEAETGVGFNSKVNLLPDVFSDKVIYCGGQVRPVLVIIVLFPATGAALRESQGANRGDVEVVIEFLRPAIGLNHLIDKD